MLDSLKVSFLLDCEAARPHSCNSFEMDPSFRFPEITNSFFINAMFSWRKQIKKYYHFLFDLIFMASDAEVFTGSLPRVLCECPHLDVNIFTPTIFHNIWNQNIGFYIFCNRLLQDIYKAQKLKISVIKNGVMPKVYNYIQKQHLHLATSFVCHTKSALGQ